MRKPVAGSTANSQHNGRKLSDVAAAVVESHACLVRPAPCLSMATALSLSTGPPSRRFITGACDNVGIEQPLEDRALKR